MSTAAPAGGLDRRNIETIQPLTPAQASLLFAALRAGGDRDPGFLQVRCTLRGMVDERALEAAWQHAIDRHGALRTSLHWQNVERPLQVVAHRASAEWTAEDLRALPEAAQERHVLAWLERDRRTGLNLSHAPLLRLGRFRHTEDRWTLVMTCHHAMLDGWSGAILLDEVAAAHDALSRGDAPSAPASPQFGEYVRWLTQQDAGAAERHWRERLAGVSECATLPVRRSLPAARARVAARAEVRLDEFRTAALHRFARAERITPGTLLCGAWAVLLAARASNRDVCFGTTVSGRNAAIPGIERMVGTLANALPVRTLVPRDTTVRTFLHDLQTRLVELTAFEHSPADRVQEWSGLPGQRRVFDTLIVVENFPTLRRTDGGLRVEDVRGGVTTTAALTLVAAPASQLELHLLCDPVRVDADALRPLLDAYVSILDGMVRAPDALLDAQSTQVDTESARRTAEGSPPIGITADDADPDTVDPVELQLIQVFERVLRVHPIGMHDDFFALGGHSLVAAQLFERIDRVFGRRLPLATLFEATTVEALARRLRALEPAAAWPSLVVMQPDGERPPLFCVHSYEGHILHYRDLARRLAPDQPVYGFQSVGLDGTQPPLVTVEQMAMRYIGEMRRIQPRGPYSIAAMCFGIAIAYEMARQLSASGEELERLFILDSGFLHFLRPPARSGHTSPRDALMRIFAHGRGLRVRAQRVLHHLRETEHSRALRRVREANERAWWRYQPTSYAGSITLLHSEEYGARQHWHVETWSRLVDAIETHVVPGDHRTVIREPHVAVLADRMRACLATRATV